MRYLTGILALLTGAAGWYYLFYSQAAQRLSSIEDERTNVRRVRLRRVAGGAMVLLGAALFAGFYTLDDADQRPAVFALLWLGVFALLILITVLAMIDVRLTRRLKSRQRGSRP